MVRCLGRRPNTRASSGLGGDPKGNIREGLVGAISRVQSALEWYSFTVSSQLPLNLSLLNWEMGVQILPWLRANAR